MSPLDQITKTFTNRVKHKTFIYIPTNSLAAGMSIDGFEIKQVDCYLGGKVQVIFYEQRMQIIPWGSEEETGYSFPPSCVAVDLESIQPITEEQSAYHSRMTTVKACVDILEQMEKQPQLNEMEWRSISTLMNSVIKIVEEAQSR